MNVDYDVEIIPQGGKMKRALITIVLITGLALVESALWLFAIVQFFLFLLKGEPNKFIVKTSFDLSEWVAETIKFVLFATNSVPFPFNPWPKNKN